MVAKPGRLWPGLRGSRIESLALSPSQFQHCSPPVHPKAFLFPWIAAPPGAESRRRPMWRCRTSRPWPSIRPIPACCTPERRTCPGKPPTAAPRGIRFRSGLIDDSDIFSIRVDPGHPQLVFASACSGIYRSDSGGEAWVKIQGIPGTHRRTHIIAEDPRNSDTIFAGTTLGLFKSPGRRQDLAAFELGTGELDGVRPGRPAHAVSGNRIRGHSEEHGLGRDLPAR